MSGTVGVKILAALAATAALAEPPAIEFLTPRDRATVLGPSTIEVRLRLPAEPALAHVELRVDGAVLATLKTPPWKADWDAGDGDRTHRIEALVVFADGSRQRAAVSTSPLQINAVERVQLVNLYALVFDPAGKYVTGLNQADFRVFESEKPQAIERFSSEPRPLHVALVLDTSASMGWNNSLEHAQEAAEEVLDVLQPGDAASVVAFSEEVHVLQELTADRQQLTRAVRSTVADGGTALYDAVWRTARELQEFEGRKVLVLLSDGRDASRSGLEPGSLHTLDEAVDEAVRSDVMVFAVGLGRDLGEELDFSGKYTLATILGMLADTTGGRAMFATGGELRRTFKEIAADLRHQYSIGYVSNQAERDGRWRSIRLQVAGRDLRVVTRKGYFGDRRRSTAAAR
ncbi:MAG TPA: VWA domain-containing protein [Candidatus Polarisedimenticolaceae bacterium]|nr:VWA domain-containing protein [Candidatus Polarisedimenticolaceae bacterium]